MNQQQDYYNALLSQQQGLSQLAQMQQQMQGSAYGSGLGGLFGGLGSAYNPEGMRNAYQPSASTAEPEVTKGPQWRFDTPARRDALAFLVLCTLIVSGLWLVT